LTSRVSGSSPLLRLQVGAENWALLASIVATCKLNGVDSVAYLAATLRAILDGHPQNRIEDLMPWRFQTASSPAAQGTAEALTVERRLNSKH
jgi:hypothetical protein